MFNCIKLYILLIYNIRRNPSEGGIPFDIRCPFPGIRSLPLSTLSFSFCFTRWRPPFSTRCSVVRGFIRGLCFDPTAVERNKVGWQLSWKIGESCEGTVLVESALRVRWLRFFDYFILDLTVLINKVVARDSSFCSPPYGWWSQRLNPYFHQDASSHSWLSNGRDWNMRPRVLMRQVVYITLIWLYLLLCVSIGIIMLDLFFWLRNWIVLLFL